MFLKKWVVGYNTKKRFGLEKEIGELERQITEVKQKFKVK